jgi:2-aminoadipate transaminase
MNYEQFYSKSAGGMKKSEIRELLKLTRRPGIISFGGGLPAPDLFPVDDIRRIIDDLMKTIGPQMLQYGPTEGDADLKDEIARMLAKDGVQLEQDQLLITTSSQQGLDLVSKIFINPGDVIVTGRPTYVGAIQAFNAYQAVLHGIDLDEEGLDVDRLPGEIDRLIKKGKKPRFIYVVPDFQNPSGITLNESRRRKLIEIAEEFDLLIVEDTPYRQLRFEGEHQKPIIGMNSERVLSLFTFSKILLPGFRMGWMAGPRELIQQAVTAKQAVDLCSPPFSQSVLAEFMKRGLLEVQIKKIIDVYRKKRDYMLEQLETHMPKADGLNWTHPRGGLFLWLNFPSSLDPTDLFKKAVERKVAYVIGSAFDPEGKSAHNMRLNFSYSSMDQIQEGIRRLSDVFRESLR